MYQKSRISLKDCFPVLGWSWFHLDGHWLFFDLAVSSITCRSTINRNLSHSIRCTWGTIHLRLTSCLRGIAGGLLWRGLWLTYGSSCFWHHDTWRLRGHPAALRRRSFLTPSVVGQRPRFICLKIIGLSILVIGRSIAVLGIRVWSIITQLGVGSITRPLLRILLHLPWLRFFKGKKHKDVKACPTQRHHCVRNATDKGFFSPYCQKTYPLVVHWTLSAKSTQKQSG